MPAECEALIRCWGNKRLIKIFSWLNESQFHEGANINNLKSRISYKIVDKVVIFP